MFQSVVPAVVSVDISAVIDTDVISEASTVVGTAAAGLERRQVLAFLSWRVGSYYSVTGKHFNSTRLREKNVICTPCTRGMS